MIHFHQLKSITLIMMSKEMKIAQKLRDPLELKPHLFTKIWSVSPKMKSSSQKKVKTK